MSTQEILAQLPRLSSNERVQVAEALRDLAASEQAGPAMRTPNQAPRWGLHAGIWEVVDDFDAPLPDEFWLGKDA